MSAVMETGPTIFFLVTVIAIANTHFVYRTDVPVELDWVAWL